MQYRDGETIYGWYRRLTAGFVVLPLSPPAGGVGGMVVRQGRDGGVVRRILAQWPVRGWLVG